MCLLLVWEKEILFLFSFLLLLHTLFYWFFFLFSFFSPPPFFPLLFFPLMFFTWQQTINTSHIPPPVFSCHCLLKHRLLHFGYLSSSIFSSLFFPLNNLGNFFFFFWCFLKKQLCQLFFCIFLIIFLCRIGNIRFFAQSFVKMPHTDDCIGYWAHKVSQSTQGEKNKGELKGFSDLMVSKTAVTVLKFFYSNNHFSLSVLLFLRTYWLKKSFIHSSQCYWTYRQMNLSRNCCMTREHYFFSSNSV